MTGYPERLLAQALHLAERDRFRPEQANLRRAVGATYYALFHALIGASCAELVGSGTNQRGLRALPARGYSHTEMERASRAFAQGRNGLPHGLRTILGESEITTPLRDLAKLLQLVQEARHKADYDLTVGWQRSGVIARITAVASCLEYLRRARTANDLRIYLVSILVWNRISNR